MILNAEVRSLKRVRIVVDRILGQKVSTNTVERICLDVAEDLATAERRAWDGVIDGEVPVPSLAIVEFDGGRIRTRKTDCGPGVHLEATGWNETKNAIFVSAVSTPSDVDPQPDPPPCFLDRDHVAKIAESMKIQKNTGSDEGKKEEKGVRSNSVRHDDRSPRQESDWSMLRTVDDCRDRMKGEDQGRAAKGACQGLCAF